MYRAEDCREILEDVRLERRISIESSSPVIQRCCFRLSAQQAVQEQVIEKAHSHESMKHDSGQPALLSISVPRLPPTGQEREVCSLQQQLADELSKRQAAARQEGLQRRYISLPGTPSHQCMRRGRQCSVLSFRLKLRRDCAARSSCCINPVWLHNCTQVGVLNLDRHMYCVKVLWRAGWRWLECVLFVLVLVRPGTAWFGFAAAFPGRVLWSAKPVNLRLPTSTARLQNTSSLLRLLPATALPASAFSLILCLLSSFPTSSPCCITTFNTTTVTMWP